MSIAYAQISKSDACKDGKFSARMSLLHAMLDLKHRGASKPIQMLTMPGAWCHFENDYLPLGIQVTGCERDKAIFQMASAHKPRNRRIKLINCEIADYMQVTDHKFDVVWLDYCGSVSDNLLKGILSLKRVLKSTSLVAITVLARRERSFYINKVRESGGRVEFLEDMIHSLVSPRLKLISCEAYNDSSPMIQVIFRQGV